MDLDVLHFLRDSVGLFKDVPEEKIAALLERSRVLSFEANEAIVEFGEEGNFLGVLMDGEAEVSWGDDAGERHRVAVLKSGDVFGEMSLMTGDRTTADVIGITRCRALIIPSDVFSSFVVGAPSAMRHVSRLIADRARGTAGLQDRKLAQVALSRSEDPYGLLLHTEVPMTLLVIHCGLSSLKYNLFHTGDETKNARGIVEHIGSDRTLHTCCFGDMEVLENLTAGTHGDALSAVLDTLASPKIPSLRDLKEITAVSHRVVHGGDRFCAPTLIDDDVLAGIERLGSMVPLHNPFNAAGIRAARALLPAVPHVAVFDTAFHHTLPPYAFLYGLPMDYYEKKGIRRFGFHGLSHFYAGLKAAQFLKRPFSELELVSCHLGNGASLCAIDHGRSVDTSMGMTPTEGLIMGTRAGDLDAGVLTYLARTEHMDIEDMHRLINQESGLLGMSGVSSDMREVESAAEAGNAHALLALKTFAYRIKKYIGAYCAAMHGVDAVIFTGSIGQGSAGARSLACQGLQFMGIVVDEEKNRAADGFGQVCDISTTDSTVRVLVVPADEERMIARETLRVLDLRYVTEIIAAQKRQPVPIEISAHHVHLCREHVEALFGPGHQLTHHADLSQPGQFACKEMVHLVGPKGRVERVRVLGPERKATQVEIAMTEQFRLGVSPPVRESGDIEDSPGLTLEGTAGSVVLDKGVICAHRHIHMSPEDAMRFGLKDRNRVRIRVETGRDLIFGDVVVRVSPSFKLAMHLDTDEGNAASITTGMNGYIDGIQTD